MRDRVLGSDVGDQDKEVEEERDWEDKETYTWDTTVTRLGLLGPIRRIGLYKLN